MTVDEMLARLGYRLDDEDAGRFTEAVKLGALNVVQDVVAGTVTTSLLRVLHNTVNLTCSNDGNALPADYFRYVGGELYKLSPVKWVTKLSEDNLGVLDSSLTKGTDKDPVCYVWGDKIYLKINLSTYGKNGSKLKLYYVKEPTTLISGGTCEIASVLHPYVVDWAESYLRKTYKYGSLEEADKMNLYAEERIKVISEQYKTGALL